MWEDGAELDPHSKSKHKILEEYFREYLITRCKHPQLGKFRIAIIDGFCGAGLYKCGSYGSPLIFLDVLNKTSKEINSRRAADGMKPVQIECLIIFNDAKKGVTSKLQENAAGFLGEINTNNNNLFIHTEYFEKKFEDIYPNIKTILANGRFQNVIFNLDQCGYSKVNIDTVRDIMSEWKSAEAFLTFSIDTVKTYFSRDPSKNSVLTRYPELTAEIYTALNDGTEILSKREWLGLIELVVFQELKNCAPFVSPFSINNPKGWRYWLMHFANRAPARRVYNDILHSNATCQAHFGRSGLKMLEFDPREESSLHLFDNASTTLDSIALHNDIPTLIEEHGDMIDVDEFNLKVYNDTAASSHTIQKVLIDNPDIEVLTPKGSLRRSHSAIRSGDTIRLKRQTSFLTFFDYESKKHK